MLEHAREHEPENRRAGEPENRCVSSFSGSPVLRFIFLVCILFVLGFQLPALSSETAIHHLTWWDILVKSDLINVIILVIVLVYLGNKFLPKVIEERKKQISKELEEARKARIKAEDELKAIQEKAIKADQEVKQIKEDAKKTAEIIKKQIEEETEKELLKLKQKVEKEIISSQEEAIQNIKKSASETALKLAEEALGKISKNDEVQKKLVDDFLSNLKAPDKN